MRILPLTTLWLLFSGAAGIVCAVDKDPGPVRYPKEIALHVTEAMAGFPAARQRFQAGLPKGSELHVSARLVDRFGSIALADLRVSKIAEDRAEVTGKIINKIAKIQGYAQGDKITVAESQLVDWKISHGDGSEEGGLFARFLASKGADADVSHLLEDELSAVQYELLDSPELRQALDQTLLQFFDDPTLKVERQRQGETVILLWPALAQKYRGLPMMELADQLIARAEALKTVLRIKVEKPAATGFPVVVMSVYVVLQRSGFIFEVKQFLHFNYGDKTNLEKVTWGLTTARPIKLKPKAG